VRIGLLRRPEAKRVAWESRVIVSDGISRGHVIPLYFVHVAYWLATKVQSLDPCPMSCIEVLEFAAIPALGWSVRLHNICTYIALYTLYSIYSIHRSDSCARLL